MDLDDAYANAKYIKGADEIAAAWPRDAAAFRGGVNFDADIPYGPGPRERFDLFHPGGTPKGLFVFVHGGYWMALGKSDWSHFARGAVDAGWAAALPEYDLCPNVLVAQIGKQIAASVTQAASLVAGPIVLAGHSAGGHLVTRMMCGDALSDEAAARVRRVVGISGIYDLRPLLQTEMNETLKLTAGDAASESPTLLNPRKGFDMIAWVGADERPAFIQQSLDLAKAWQGKLPVKVVTVPGQHHFNVIDDLREPKSALMQTALAN